MKHSGLVVFLLVFSTAAFAERFSSTIHSVALGKEGEPHIIRFDNARAAFLPSTDEALVMTFISKSRTAVEVEVDTNNTIVAAREIHPEDPEPRTEANPPRPSEPFPATVVRTSNMALSIFRNMRRDYLKGGECYNRAHVWAYEDHQKSQRNLMKIFMFFTDRYIRKYKYHWWFHVTPMVYVGDKNSPRTLDRRYTSGPRQTKTWSDIFIKSKRRCKKVDTFDEYYLNQQSEDCYHIHTSMYYVVPRDIEKRDLTQVEKGEFNEKEINRAYQNAFKKR